MKTPILTRVLISASALASGPLASAGDNEVLVVAKLIVPEAGFYDAFDSRPRAAR